MKARKIVIFSLMLCVMAQAEPSSKKPQASKEVAQKTGRILFYMPIVSKSMKITFMPLAEELASRGHEVVVIMPHDTKSKNPKLHILQNQSPFDELTQKISKKILHNEQHDPVSHLFPMIQGAVDSNDNALQHPELRKHLEKGFDVVLVSPFICSEAGYYLAERGDAALVIYFTGQVSLSTVDWAVGQPHNPAYLPFVMFDIKAPFSFLQRVGNTLATVLLHTVRDFYFIRQGEALLDKHFPGEKRTPLLDIERNASLVLHYGHPLIMDGQRPLAPNFQYIGMMNCRDPEPLTKDLDDFMQSGKDHGVIFVSFGSVLQAKEMTEDVRKMFVSVFGKLKQKVIWKWETEQMPDKPNNLKLSKWLPQQDILGHPNTKLFITHAGQSSIQETLCHQKPVIAIPMFGDQPANAKEAVRVGFGQQLNFHELTEEQLLSTIKEALDNPKYTQVAQEHGGILNDQISRPLDRAVWWLEFLIRHPGKNHFKSPVHDLAWYQYFLLDVLLFLAAVGCFATYLFVFCCRCICCRRGGLEKPNTTEHQRRKKKTN